MPTLEINLPHNGWLPRRHQLKLWNYLQRGGKRAIAVWHRRAGKDEIALHHTAVAMIQRPANYWHCLPEFQMARRAIWTAINPHTGKRRIDEAFPVEMRENTNDNEMMIRLVNGSTWQVIGSDSFDRTVGSSAAGVVYSEYALANPSAWAYHRPMIEENNGWALFITTPRGRNHALDLYSHAQHTPGWFSETLTVADTRQLSRSTLDEALKEYRALYGVDVGTAQFRQEYYCDWNAAVLGAFYAHEMALVRSEGRITAEARAIPHVPVSRAWDLGVRDDTAIWWWQPYGMQVLILDVYSSSGVGLEHYADIVAQRRDEHGWTDGDDYVPQDAKVKELGTGRTRVETMQRLNLHPMLVPAATVEDGINAVRRTLPLAVFHPRCEAGISALEQYRREWDDAKKCFRASPLHDWTSDKADAFRYLALSWRKPAPLPAPKPRRTGWVIPPPPEPRKGMRL